MRAFPLLLLPPHIMSSQPDMTRARQLAPNHFPADPAEENVKLKFQIEYLASMVAKYEKKTVKQVLEEAAHAMGANAPQVTAPVEGEEAKRPAGDAKFFGNKKKDVYYPIEMRTQGAFKNMKEDNIVYFFSEEEATAANYKPFGS